MCVSGTSTFAGRCSFDSNTEKNGWVRTIAVGDVFHRLVSNLSCRAIKPNLPSFFIPYGQVGVGVNGGMMAAINALRLCISEKTDDESHCLLKVDMA